MRGIKSNMNKWSFMDGKKEVFKTKHVHSNHLEANLIYATRTVETGEALKR